MSLKVKCLATLIATILVVQNVSSATPNAIPGTFVEYNSVDCSGEPASMQTLLDPGFCPVQTPLEIISFRRGETSVLQFGVGVQVRCLDQPTVETPNRLIMLDNIESCSDPTSNIVGEITSTTDNFDVEGVKLCITDQDQDNHMFEGKSFVLSCPIPTKSPTPPTSQGPSASPITSSPSLSPTPEPTASPETPTTETRSSVGHVTNQISSSLMIYYYTMVIVMMIGFNGFM